jgi:hypothetical protein
MLTSRMDSICIDPMVATVHTRRIQPQENGQCNGMAPELFLPVSRLCSLWSSSLPLEYTRTR